MPNITVTIAVDIDGQAADGFPLVHRLSTTEVQAFRVTRADDGGPTFGTLPVDAMGTLEALVVTTDQAVTVRLDNQTDAGIILSPGGLLLILDATIDAGATLNAKVNNQSGSTATLRGLGAGF